MTSRYTAKVKLTVEVSDVGTWEKSCSIEQIQMQATRSAVGQLKAILSGKDVRIVGNPEVQTIIINQVQG